MTDEIIVMLVGILIHIPFWFFMLLVIDIKKSGGRVRDAFKLFNKVIKTYAIYVFFQTNFNVSRKRMWKLLRMQMN